MVLPSSTMKNKVAVSSETSVHIHPAGSSEKSVHIQLAGSSETTVHIQLAGSSETSVHIHQSTRRHITESKK